MHVHAHPSAAGPFLPGERPHPDRKAQGAPDLLGLADTLKHVAPAASEDLAGGSPMAPDIRGCLIGRVELVEATGTDLTLRAQGCASEAQVAALVQLEGSASIRQGERTAELAPGDLCLLRSGRPLELKVAGAFRIVLAGVPEDELADRFPLWRAAMVTAIRADSGVPAVLCDALTSLHRWRHSLGEVGSDGLADAVVDLLGALICFAGPANPDCIQQSLYQRDRIKKVAQLNLRNPELDVDYIAGAVGLSSRQVHRLFADEGTSLMRWVWVQRLEQCYRELCHEESRRRSISDIAYAWGFNDQAHFSRAFRKHFGVAPRELRRRGIAVTANADGPAG